MLEKARMKGKKGPVTNTQSSAQNAEFDDEGVCCTCGQQVGQHSHVSAGGTGQMQGVGSGHEQGQGPGRGK
jgi:hypothetical protein